MAPSGGATMVVDHPIHWSPEKSARLREGEAG
jgi:hypothetical protein